MKAIFYFLFFQAACAGASTLQFSAESASYAGVEAKNLRAELADSRLTLSAEEMSLAGKSWKKPYLRCERFSFSQDAIGCQGRLFLDGEWQSKIRYLLPAEKLDLEILPAPQESWQLAADFKRGEYRLKLSGAKLARLNPYSSFTRFSSGSADGEMDYSPAAADALLSLREVAFSDPEGLHAGEKIAADFSLRAKNSAGKWLFAQKISATSGEVYWQPFYFSGSKSFSSSGSFDGKKLAFTDAKLEFPEIGEISGAFLWDMEKREVTGAEASGKNLALSAINDVFVNPMVRDTSLSETAMGGTADADFAYRDGKLQRLDLLLKNASFSDRKGRFSLSNLNANIPWRLDSPADARIEFASGKLFRIPLGKTEIPVRMDGKTFTLRRVQVPVLDGTFSIDGFRAREEKEGWRWAFKGGLTPVAMEKLSDALGWPQMHGTFSGVIPRVSFADSKLAVDGALLFKVFDGTVVAQHLTMQDPFGVAPRLAVDLDMKNLDLGLLTRTFSFGSIEGRVDVSVKGLELSDWKPVAFAARVETSEGKFEKRISQRAVQNISSLGGAGAASAIQRSFLSFFKEFGYERIGFGCVLRNDICKMNGVEDTGGGFMLVKGGGIPAINVIGYNRYIGWDELVSRLERITEANVQPVVK